MAKSYGYYRRDSDSLTWSAFERIAARRNLSMSAAILEAVHAWVTKHQGDPVPAVFLPPKKEKPPAAPGEVKEVRDPFADYNNRQPNPNIAPR